MLHRALRTELETFLAHARERDRPVPRFVERELRAYLECGLPSYGFLRVRCPNCGHERLVAFSCKGRGFCPSCGGRRMAETAAHLVDQVLPEVPVRQWVLSLPFELRYRLAYDRELSSDVLGVFLRAVFAGLRRRAGTRVGRRERRLQCGAVSFVQRFGDALNLNLHFHSLVLDGVYHADPRTGAVRFVPLAPPDDAEVARVARRVARSLRRLLARRGLLDAEPADADPISRDAPLLAEIASASIRGRAAAGPRAGRRLQRFGDRVDREAVEPGTSPLCAEVAGLSLHAGVAVPARDRARLERLCRYVARPPLATGRLSELPDGRLCYRLRHRWRDGTTHVLFQPLELIERLAALIPPPRAHQVRYHGVLAPCAAYRDAVVPGPGPAPRPRVPHDPAASPASQAELPAPSPQAWERDGPAATPDPTPNGLHLRPDLMPPTATPALRSAEPEPAGRGPRARPRRLAWAELMRRVFARDVLACPRCNGRMRVLSAIEAPSVVEAILGCLDLPARPPPLSPARPLEAPEPAFTDLA